MAKKAPKEGGRNFVQQTSGASRRLDGRNQQVRIAWTPIIDFKVDHDLVLGLLQLHHLAELVRLAGLAFANDLRRWLEQAEDLAFGVCIAAEDARSRLLHHLLDQRHQRVELMAQASPRQTCRQYISNSMRREGENAARAATRRAGPPVPKKSKSEIFCPLIQAVAPKDEVEAALAVQMAATHSAAMMVLVRLGGGHGGERRVAALGSAAARLMRAYTHQVETLSISATRARMSPFAANREARSPAGRRRIPALRALPVAGTFLR
jgi:hypothetical protein